MREFGKNGVNNEKDRNNVIVKVFKYLKDRIGEEYKNNLEEKNSRLEELSSVIGEIYNLSLKDLDL